MGVLWDKTFESNNLTGTDDSYDSAVTDGGDLSVAGAAALAGTSFGVSHLVDDATIIYGLITQGDTGTGKFRVRFYLDMNALSMDNFESHALFYWLSTTQNYIFALNIRGTAGDDKTIQIFFFDDDGYVSAQNVSLSDAEHYIEVYVVQASNDVAGDGTIDWWIDGVGQIGEGPIDNFDIFADTTAIKAGAHGDIHANTSGTYYLDQIKANDDGSEIGVHEEVVGETHSLAGSISAAASVISGLQLSSSLGGSSVGALTTDAGLLLLRALGGSSSGVSTVSAGLLRLLQLASVKPSWVGISSSNIHSKCGEGATHTLAEGLDGTDYWEHDANHEHWFIVDLGQSYRVSKVRGRSNTLADPLNVAIYVSNDVNDWGVARASHSPIGWAGRTTFLDVSINPKFGRYVKVSITTTEQGDKHLTFGNNFTIFDVYGVPNALMPLGQSSISGSLTIEGLAVELAAAISASCTIEASLDISKVLSASVSGTVTTEAALLTLIQIGAEVATQSSTSVSLNVLKNMAAAILATCSTSASITTAVVLLAAAIIATCTVSARMIIDGVASGVDEGVRNEFQFPHIPDSVPEDVKNILAELRTMLEQRLIGDFYIGGNLHTDGTYFGHLIHGGIHVHAAADDIALAAESTFYQITSFDTNGNSNGMTPDHTSSHITIITTGNYMVSLSVSMHSHASNDYEVWVRKNNGTTGFESLVIHQTTAVAGRVDSGAVTLQIHLSEGDTLEAWVQRTDGEAVEKTITIDHINLAASFVGA